MNKASLVQGKQLLELFSGANVEEAQTVVENGDLVKAMYKADLTKVDRAMFEAVVTGKFRLSKENLKKALSGNSPLEGLLLTPEQMLEELIARAGKRQWKLSKSLLERLAKTIPQAKPDRMVIYSFDLWLGKNLEYNVNELIGWVRDRTPGFYLWPEVNFDAEHLRLFNSQRVGKNKFAGWCAIDVGSTYDSRKPESSHKVRTAASPGLEVITGWALHNAYPPAIDYKTIPGLWLPGLEANWSGHRDWQRVPYLYWHRVSREVDVNFSLGDIPDSGLFVPRLREL